MLYIIILELNRTSERQTILLIQLFYSCREWDKFNSSIGQAPPYAVFCELYQPTRNTTFGIKNL